MASAGISRRVVLVSTDVLEVFFRSVRRLLVMANIVPSSSILVTLIMEAFSSSQTSVLTRATRRTVPGDTILHGQIQFEILSLYVDCHF
jgi:hypothetical protein